MEEKVNNSQVSEVEEDKKGSEVFKTAVKIATGFILILLGLVAIIGWWSALTTVFKGCIGLFQIMAGAITIAIAKE